MQAARLAALVLLLCAVLPAQAQPTLPLAFQPPAQLSPQGNATGLEWALFVFRDPSATAVAWEARGTPTATNYSMLSYVVDQPPAVGYGDKADLPPQGVAVPEGFQQTLSFPHSGWASLYVAADEIMLGHAGDEGSLFPVLNGSLIQGGLPDAVPPVFRNQDLRAPADSAGLLLRGGAGAFPFTVKAEGVHRVEYSNARSACPSGQACLDGAAPSTWTVPTPGGTARARLASILALQAADGHLEGGGAAAFVLAGGVKVTLHEQGTARLPLASRSAPCPRAPCLDPHGQTVHLEGNLTLADLHAQGDGLATDLSGHFTAAALDEVAVPASRLSDPATVVAAVAGLALVALLAKPAVRLLVGLFSRELTTDRALDNPGRRATYEAVCAHPGATYRALMGATGLSDSITRHHLKKLVSVGLVAVQQHGRTVRYFENHGRYAASWRSVVAGQEPAARQLLAWLQANPGCTQQEAVSAGAGFGLTRWATQRRLRRLEALGLLSAQREGRCKHYTLALPDTAAPTPPMAPGD